MELDSIFNKPNKDGETGSSRDKSLFERAMDEQGYVNDRSFSAMANRNFHKIDSDMSETLSQAELSTASSDESDKERQTVARILLKNFDEAKEIATSATPFAVSKWSLNIAASNYWEPRFSNDNKPDISRKDVTALEQLERYQVRDKDRLWKDQDTTGFYTGIGSTVGFVGLGALAAANVLPTPAKVLLYAGSSLLLATSLRAIFNGADQVDNQIDKRNTQVRDWLLKDQTTRRSQ
jgi:hypothetical protein